MNYVLNKDWKDILKDEINKDYFKKLMNRLDVEYRKKIIFPPQKQIFSALNLTPFSNIKVVVIGQDPYHGINQANGLAFSVSNNQKLPPSLLNIFKEIKRDIGITIPKCGDLSDWAKQGVLLLNTVFTVEQSRPYSHSLYGWQNFSNKIVELIDKKSEAVVFLLWGNHAKKYRNLIKNKIHLVLESSHPSPFSFFKGFWGCSHFSRTNKFLLSNKIEPVNWKIQNP